MEEAVLQSHVAPTGSPLTTALLVAAASALLYCLAPLLRRIAWGLLVFYTRLDIRGPPAANILLGHMPMLMSDKMHFQVEKLEQRYGPIFKLRFFSEPVVVLADPAAMATVNR